LVVHLRLPLHQGRMLRRSLVEEVPPRQSLGQPRLHLVAPPFLGRLQLLPAELLRSLDPLPLGQLRPRYLVLHQLIQEPQQRLHFLEQWLEAPLLVLRQCLVLLPTPEQAYSAAVPPPAAAQCSEQHLVLPQYSVRLLLLLQEASLVLPRLLVVLFLASAHNLALLVPRPLEGPSMRSRLR